MKERITYVAIITALILTINHFQKQTEYYKETASQYRQNQNILNTQLRRIYHEKNMLQKQNEKLEKSANEDIKIFDWYRDISITSVIKRLRQN